MFYDSLAIQTHAFPETSMKKLIYFCAVFFLALTPAIAMAADVTGTWAGSMKGPDGGDGFALSITFKQDGTKLTGSINGPQGDPITISDGKVEGDKISFSVSFNGMTITHEGTINGDEIKLVSKSDGGMGGGEMTLKRVPASSAPSSGAGTAPASSGAAPATH